MRRVSNARRLLLAFMILVVAAVAYAARNYVGHVLFSRFVDEISELGLTVTAQRPRWTGRSIVVDDVLVRCELQNSVVELGAKRATVTLSISDLIFNQRVGRHAWFERPVIDLVTSSEVTSILDIGILDDVKGGEMTVSPAGSGIHVEGSGINVRTRRENGEILSWFRDVRFRFDAPQLTSLADGQGDFSSGTVLSRWMLLGGTEGRFVTNPSTVRVDPLVIRFTRDSELRGTLVATSLQSGSAFRFEAAQQPVDLLDVMTATVWRDPEKVDFSKVPPAVSPTQDSVVVDLHVVVDGSNLEAVSGRGVVTVKPGSVPRLPLTDGVAGLLGVLSPDATHHGGAIRFDISPDAVRLRPGVVTAEGVALCIGGLFELHRPVRSFVWALVQLDRSLVKAVRASGELLGLLQNGADRYVIPIRLTGEHPAIFLPTDYPHHLKALPRGTAIDAPFFGSMSRCW